MKQLLRTFIIVACLIPFTAFGTECRAPQMVEEIIVELDGMLLDYQKQINAEGNICPVLVRQDASLGEVYEGQMRALNNGSLSLMTQFLGDLFQPQDFLDDFQQAVPFMDRPYALNFDLDRIQLRMDRLWDMQLKAHKFCQTERAAVMRDDWAVYFDTIRLIRHADEPLYLNQPNPFYIGFAEGTPEYTKYAATGFYNHPEQRACSDEELNIEQIGTKLEKVYDSLSNAVEEVDHEFKEQIKGVETTWKDVDRLKNELNGTLNNLFSKPSTEQPKKTMDDVLKDLSEAKGEALSNREFLNAYNLYEQQYETNTDIANIRREIEAVYADNTHIALRIQEQELDNMVRTLMFIDSYLSKNIGSLEQLCKIQAKDIPCPSLTSITQ